MRILHTMLRVNDMKESISFYEKFFDMKDYQYLLFDREEGFTLIDGTFLIDAEK